MTRLLLPILAILIAIGIFFGYVSPTWNGPIAQAKTQIASYNSALAAAAAFTTKENQLLAEENAIPAASLARLAAYLPDGVDNVQLILDLNSLASKSGMTLSNFNVADDTSDDSSDGSSSGLPESTNPVDSLTLSVTAAGTYPAFRAFLAGTEQSLRPLDVTNLTLADSATGVYNYTITYRIYWLH
jgi:hypothetical protein